MMAIADLAVVALFRELGVDNKQTPTPTLFVLATSRTP